MKKCNSNKATEQQNKAEQIDSSSMGILVTRDNVGWLVAMSPLSLIQCEYDANRKGTREDGFHNPQDLHTIAARATRSRLHA